MSDESPVNPIVDAADSIADKLNADVILYNGPINSRTAIEFTRAVNKRRRRDNVLLLLVTFGGEAGAAYRIATVLQEKYGKFTLFASGYCKSAGTLIATGAHELVMSDCGELGPLDVQMSKRDEILEMQSGLTIIDTLTALHGKALDAFEEFFLTLSAKSGGSITLRTATDIATAMTTGLFTPLYAQMDPLLVGEAGRAMRIAAHYGSYLLRGGKNIDPDVLERMLLQGYPSHDFVINRQEADRLFENVRLPTETEELLSDLLGDKSLIPQGETDPEGTWPFVFLSTEKIPSENAESSEDSGGQDNEQIGEINPEENMGLAAKALPYLSEAGGGEEDS